MKSWSDQLSNIGRWMIRVVLICASTQLSCGAQETPPVVITATAAPEGAAEAGQDGRLPAKTGSLDPIIPDTASQPSPTPAPRPILTTKSAPLEPEAARKAGLQWERDVTKAPYLADPSGVKDSTGALRQAVAEAQEITRQEGHATLIFPEGRYLVSGTISLGANELAARRFHLRGAGPAKTFLVLKDNCGRQPGQDDFTDAAAPQPVLSFLEGNYSEVALGNTLEDLSIDVGTGNPGAIGVVFHTSLYGAIRNVHILDAHGAGHTGLVLGKRMAGPGVLENVIIRGFETGLMQNDDATYAYGFAANNLALLGQRMVGAVTERRLLAVDHLLSSGAAPLLQQLTLSGMAVVVNSQIVDNASPSRRPYPNAGFVWAHDPEKDKPDQYVIIPKESESLWKDLPKTKGAVAKPADEPTPPTAGVEKFVSIPSPGPDRDASPAIQAAIDGGATTLELPDSLYLLEHTIRLAPTLTAIRGNWSCLAPAGELRAQSGKPVFEIAGGPAAPLQISRLESHNIGDGAFVWIEHTAERKVILRDMVLSGGAGAYVGAGHGSLEINDMAYTSAAKPTGEPAWLIQGQKVRALGWTVFADFPHLVNDGGELEVTGFFLGNQHGPYLLNLNGAKSRLYGVFAMALKTGGIPSSLPAFVNDNSDLELNLLEHSTLKLGYDQYFETGGHSVLVREFHQGEVRELLKEDATARGGEGITGSGVAHYASRLSDDGPATCAVAVSVPGAGELHEGETAVVRVERQGDLSKELTVYYQLEGDAGSDLDLDMAKLKGSLTLPAGQATQDLAIPILTDGEEEAPEALIVRLSGGSGYRVLYGRHAVRVNILDLPPAKKAGMLAHYSFADGEGLDESGNNHHARIWHATSISNGDKFALNFNGRAQWVEISPSLREKGTPQAQKTTPPAPSEGDPIVTTAPAAPPGPGTALFADKPAAAPSEDPLEAALEALDPGGPAFENVANAPSAAAPAPFLHEPVEFRSVVMRFFAQDTTKSQTLYEEGGVDNGLSLVLRRGDLIFTAAAHGQKKSVRAAVDPKFWVHVVAVFDAGAMRLYLDGRLWNEAMAEFTKIPGDPSGAAIAATLDGGPDCPAASYFQGIAGDVSIYGKSLKLNDAKQLFVGE